MTAKGGRDRLHRDYPSRSEEKSQAGRGSALSSRHLWVGNLSHNVSEATLCDHFLRYGELENIAFQPGRCYAFINFRKEEDAIAAMKGLQGFHIAGLRLKIEFAKAEKSLPQVRDEDYVHRRDEQRSIVRGPPSSQRDSRTYHGSPDKLYSDNLKMSDTNEEPSEVLWIGFPALLKVDEMILRKAFSPFGEIDKITVFPGRSYAFVQFKSVMAAWRARETLNGKLFGNPKVHICFSRSEHGKQNSGKSSANVPQSPHFKPTAHRGSSDNSFWEDRKFGGFPGDSSERCRFSSNLEFGDSDVGRWTSDSPFGQRRHRETGLEAGRFEHYSSGTRDGDFSSQKYPQYNRSLLYDDDSWDLPEDSLLLHGSKKLKIGSFHPEKELPDYPFSDFGRPTKTVEKHVDGVYKQLPPDYLINLTGAAQWTDSLDDYQQQGNIVDDKRAGRSCSNGEWKWEGVIAKGGTAICRARCFPVGKPMDVVLPEFLDCTARTSLEMLAKHYYQAAGAWVVFFVPETDVDIGFYNEFMHYLEEKQRAAVAKLDEKTTLFLVPPSDLSQNVLKVPGKLSISGVVLKLENGGHQPAASPSRSFAPIYADKSSGPNNNTFPSAAAAAASYGGGNDNMQGAYVFQQPNNPPPLAPALLGGGHHQGSILGNRSYEVGNKKAPPSQEETGPAPSQYGADVVPGTLRQHDLAAALLRQQQQSTAAAAAQRRTSVDDQLLTSQFGYQQLQNLSVPQIPVQTTSATTATDKPDEDPQKRLQATLQLAAALLQQIQQGKPT